MKKYAYVDFGGYVVSIETRCACRYIKEKGPNDEWALEEIIHGSTGPYVEIPDGVEVREGMLYSDGVFKENPTAPDKRISDLEKQTAANSEAILGLMDMNVM